MKSWITSWRGGNRHVLLAPQWLIALGVVASLTICAASLMVAVREWRSAIDVWRARTASASTLLSAQARQVLLGAEVILRGLQRDVTSLNIEDEDAFRAEMSTRRVFDSLRDRMEGAPQIDVATITDVNGQILNFSRQFPPPPINLSDRDYFRKRMHERSTERFVSVPVQNRGTGTWVFYMAEPILGKSGQVLGLALVGIRSDYFHDFYKASFPKGEREIVLVRADGVVLAREPNRLLPGASIAGAAFLKDPAAYRRGVWTSEPAVEKELNQPRFIGVTQADGYPVMVSVTAFGEMALADWQELARFMAIAALGASALLIGFSFWGARMLANQRRMLLEVNNARDAAEQADRAKTTFLSVVSHELRTPLNSLIGGADLVRRASDIEKMRKYSEVIDVSARQILGMIDGILNFSKSDLQKAEPRKAVFVLRDICNNCLSIGRGMAANKPVRLICLVDDSVPARLVGDDGILTQILLNLVSNAVKYTESGDIRIHVEAGPVEGGVTELRITVQDSGKGIPSDLRARLFQPFQRGAGQEVQRQQGTGLGLAIVERYVRRIGGVIRAEASPSGGACFVMEIPFGVAAGVESGEIEANAAKPMKVLVAEDTAASRFVVRAMLEKLGHDVTVTTGGGEAVDAASMKRFDLVLLDVGMQDMTGYEACRLIKALPGYAATPIVAMTAYSDPEAQRSALDAGMVKLFTKPIRVSDLANLIGETTRASDASPA